MKLFWSVLTLTVCFAIDAIAQEAQRSQVNTNRAGNRPGPDRKMDAFYKLGPDSMRQEGVPEGRFDGPKVIASEAYPGTQHTYWVYVPAQYDPAKAGGAHGLQ